MLVHWATAETDTTKSEMVGVSSATEDSVSSVLHFFFAICVSLVSTMFAYVAASEGKVMKTYQTKGRSIEGRILDWKYSRRIPNENDDEYDVTVDYKCIEVGGYTTVIRKQLKCRRSELYIADDSQHEFVKVCVELENVFSFEEAMFDRPNRQRIRLLLLDEFPNSGIPQRTVRDAMRLGRRAPVLACILLLLLLTAFCVFLGLATLIPANSLSGLTVIALSLAAATTLCLVEYLVLWGTCLYYKMDSVLTSEYLEAGEMLVKVDTETLGTLSTCESMSSHWLSSNQTRSTISNTNTTRSRDSFLPQ